MCWKGAGGCWRASGRARNRDEGAGKDGRHETWGRGLAWVKGAAKLGRDETRGTRAGIARRGGQGNEKKRAGPSFLFFLVDLVERVVEDLVAQGGEPGGEGDGVEGVGLVEVVLVG